MPGPTGPAFHRNEESLATERLLLVRPTEPRGGSRTSKAIRAGPMRRGREARSARPGFDAGTDDILEVGARFAVSPRELSNRPTRFQSSKSWPWPAWPPAALSSFLGRSAISVSVVSMRPATDAAFWIAVRTTLAGSITPALTRSVYSSLAA